MEREADDCGSCVRLSLEVWTVDVVAACRPKGFQVAREAVQIRKQYYRSHCRSRFPLSQQNNLSEVARPR